MNIKGWTTQTLRDLATINYGKSPAEILSSEGYYPVVGTGGTDRLGTDFLYEGDSIILGRKGTIDRVYFTTGKFWIIDTAYYLNEFIDTYPLWLFYFLQTIDLRQMNEATGVPSLSRDALYKIKVQTPSLKEQEKIADILSKIDRAIAQTEAIIAKQQRIKTGLMQDLLTKGIDENGNIRSEATHEFKDSSIGRIPVDWEVTQIINVLSSSPKNGYSPQESDSWQGVYVLGLGCLTVDGFRPTQLKKAPSNDTRTTATILKDGDFLISRANTRDLVGLVGIYCDVGEPCIYPDLMVRLQFDETVNIQYMERVFTSRIVRRQIQNAATGTSSSMVKINSIIIKECYFLKPELNEQNRIIYILEKHSQAIKIYIKQLQKLKLQKTGLMQDLLTGKVRVTPLLEQEPASR
jgi:type I restriction enzyme, S subunit